MVTVGWECKPSTQAEGEEEWGLGTQAHWPSKQTGHGSFED